MTDCKCEGTSLCLSCLNRLFASKPKKKLIIDGWDETRAQIFALWKTNAQRTYAIEKIAHWYGRGRRPAWLYLGKMPGRRAKIWIDAENGVTVQPPAFTPT
jgi:hypothetical protein